MTLPVFLQSVVDFVRKGYPQGVPQEDYLPLLALLRRRLADDEVGQVAADLAATGNTQFDSAAISAAIQNLTNQPPSNADIDRVRQHLETVGWPD